MTFVFVSCIDVRKVILNLYRAMSVFSGEGAGTDNQSFELNVRFIPTYPEKVSISH